MPRALRAEPDLAGLSATNTGGEEAGAFAQADAGDRGGRSMVTCALGGETAMPIEQITEILAYQPDLSVFANGGSMLGLVVNQGRSIPVMCLARLTGASLPGAGPGVSVLVVACADHPPLRAATGPLDTRRLARVGGGDSERLLPVLDLQRLARSLQLQAAGTALRVHRRLAFCPKVVTMRGTDAAQPARPRPQTQHHACAPPH